VISYIAPGKQRTKLRNLRAWLRMLETSIDQLSSIYGLYTLRHCTALLGLPSYPHNCFLLYLVAKNNCAAQTRYVLTRAVSSSGAWL